MDNNTNPPVPYLTHEADMMRADMMHRRLLRIIVLLIIALAATNIAWVVAWQSYDFESYQIEQDGEGINIVGNENKDIQVGTESPDKAQDKAGQQGQSDP